MILKYKYHSDSGLLEAYRSYTLAQNNSLSDTIVITSTAPDAQRYNYCLEFICYNSKSIPKAQYISPILNYGDEGISFVIPNNLTEFRGHVDMQLTGYDPDDNSIVFKSISKNCKAFDIEGSLCVLEKDLNDTPNVFTEVLKQLEDLKNIHQDIIDEAMDNFFEKIIEKVAAFKWCKVSFYDNGRLLQEQWVCAGSKLTSPSYTLPEHCVLVEGWYNPATETIWNMDEDTVQENTKLYLNYMSDEVVIAYGEVRNLSYRNFSHAYVPEYYGGYKVTSVRSGTRVPIETQVHFGNNMENFESLLTDQNAVRLFFPEDHPLVVNDSGNLYVVYDEENILVFAAKQMETDVIAVKYGCKTINTFAINNVSGLKRLILPDSLQHLFEQCIVNTGLEVLKLPSNICMIAERAIFNNFKLKEILLEGDVSNLISDESFVNIDEEGNVTRPTLCVYPQHYANYLARGLAYQIKVVGQNYLDGRYAQKEN